MSTDDPTDERTLGQEMTRFLSDPSAVLDAAASDPGWAADPVGTLDKHLAQAGYSETARAHLRESAKQLNPIAAELLAALGI